MTKISETDYLSMSKEELYKEYCKIYNEYENLVKKEIKALKCDRNQYSKDYSDGIKDVLTMLWLFDQQNVVEIIDKYRNEANHEAERKGVIKNERN